MNQRKRLIIKRRLLEQQLLSQQQQIAKHAISLSVWYRAHVFSLWSYGFSMTVGLVYLRYRWRESSFKDKPWIRRTRLGFLWLLDFVVLNPRILRHLFKYIFVTARQTLRPERQLVNHS